eukprot:gene16119-21909_t
MTSLACCGGFIDNGQPQGEVRPIAGINCYVSTPNDIKNKKSAIIIATDVFGYTLPNVRLIADSYAQRLSTVVVVPDFFVGTELPASLMGNIETLTGESSSFFSKIGSFGVLLWYLPMFLLRNSAADSASRVERVIAELRLTLEINQVAIQGYCWGGRVAIMLGQKESVVGVICPAHPGGLKYPDDFNKIIKPSCFIFAQKDFEINETRIEQIKSILETKNKDGNFPHIIKNYSNMVHGFAVRGSENIPEVKQAREDAFTTSADFFQQILKLEI